MNVSQNTSEGSLALDIQKSNEEIAEQIASDFHLKHGSLTERSLSTMVDLKNSIQEVLRQASASKDGRIAQLEGWLNEASNAVGGADLDCVASAFKGRIGELEGILLQIATHTDDYPETEFHRLFLKVRDMAKRAIGLGEECK